MSWIGEAIINLHNWREGVSKVKADLKKDENPLRIGILSAAAINYAAIIDPVQTHTGSIISGIAARDVARAQAQIDSRNLGKQCKAYGSYAELLEDRTVEAVYIPLPNGLHAEWAIKAMEAGKHVLIEKPLTVNAEQARRLEETAVRTNKIALEAFHWRFHPASHAVKAIVDSGRYGHPTSIFARMMVPSGWIGKNDIRFNYALGGGSILDLTYVLSACCYFSNSDITKCSFDVLSAVPRLNAIDQHIDEAMESKFVVRQEGKPAVHCHVQADLAMPAFLGFIPKVWKLRPIVSIELEKARIDFTNFAVPTFGHSIVVSEKDDNGRLTGKKHTEAYYTGGRPWEAVDVVGEAWWTTYRYQLEAFVRQVRAKQAGERFEGPCIDLSDSEKLMELIDSVYDKADLPKRGI